MACSKSQTTQSAASIVTPTPAPTPAPQHASNQCKSEIVDTGQKGSVATVARGNYSDTKIIPATSSPATAFVDASAASVKISYWNGSGFSSETISGDGGASFLRLAFFSSGVPLVLWTQGVNLKAAIRSAPFGTVGIWSAGVIDTGLSPRAVEVAINPLQQVAVSFLTDTAVTGRAKFLYCGSPCLGPSGFQTMNTNLWIDNTNILAAEVATGVAWCQASSSSYYPAAVYGVTGSTHYAVCLNTLPNCLNGANWNTGVVLATASISSKLLLDPTVTGDIPKVMTLGAAGVTPYKMGTTSCSSLPGAFSAGTTMGSATSGNAWMSFLKDSSGKFHLVANEGTTAVKYYNSTAANDPTLPWNIPQAVETVTLSAAAGGGADLDLSTQSLYTSYGQNAIPYDIRLARVNNYTQASNAVTFTKGSADTSGDLQLSTSQIKNIAVASTSQGLPASAWIDFSVGSVANAKLVYALRSGNSSSSAWSEQQLVPDTINPQFPALIFDQNNLPWISYFDAGLNKFFLTTNSSSDGSGSWSVFEYPATPAGAPLALPAANSTALVLSHFGGVANPMMFVIDTNAGSKGVKATVFNESTRIWGTTYSVDGLTAGALGATFLTASATTAGVAIAFQDLNVARAKYISTVDGVHFTPAIYLTSPNQGQGLSLAINPVSGSPGVTFFDVPNNALYYASCSGTLTNCATGGWMQTQVDASVGVNGLTSAAYQLVASSLQFDTLGAPYIFYPRGQGNDGNLILNSNQNGNFVSVVAGYGSNGNMAGMPPLNFGVAGWDVSAATNAAGSFTAVYLGPGNRIYSTSCGD